MWNFVKLINLLGFKIYITALTLGSDCDNWYWNTHSYTGIWCSADMVALNVGSFDDNWIMNYSLRSADDDW